ncbi:MAG: hypothetical protein Kow0068_07850 [Marinilabiliales bacterium]
MKIVIIIFFQTLIFYGFSQGPFSPAAEQTGSNAIHKDSSVFIDWASGCYVQRGYVNIADTSYYYIQGGDSSNYAFYGNDSSAIGTPDGIDVVSLGDGGSAILTFNNPITNGLGYDFAVFENGMQSVPPSNEYYLELAFVEVSSDGINYVRFPSVSLTQDTVQVETYGLLNPTYIHNLAGKYTANYGTPFDLEELKDSSNLDINNITHVKIIDVIGSIQANYANYDSQGHIINDPWPTPFWSSGFDLDAVGVINNSQNNIKTFENKDICTIYPNPAKINDVISVKLINNNNNKFHFDIIDISGSVIKSNIFYGNSISITVDFTNHNSIYFIKIYNEKDFFTTKKILIQI